ncbi:S8 family serine peptidase [Pilimelia columellifera]|uniref:S8 family serine peptidase n=1 Tax=Pilimelia columellifera subsp. columellifera TaxID=706583 RepID=A0ABP6AY16_9ACTN
MRLLPRALALTAAVACAASALTAPPADATPPTAARPDGFAAESRPAPRRTAAAPRAVPDTVLVRFKDGATATRRAKALRARGARAISSVAGDGIVQVKAGGPATALLGALRRDPAVASAALNHRRTLAAAPDDEGFVVGAQEYLKTVRLPQAWDVVTDTTSQIIAVIDTGVDGSHPDLAGRLVPGFNAVTPGGSTTDTAFDPETAPHGGHGTMVAGVAAARTNNGVGIAGAAHTGRIMPVKVFGPDGSAADLDIIEGIDWATAHGAKVINLSLGGPEDSPLLREALQRAVAAGVVVVAAAGNTGENTPQYPAAYPEAIAVGATDDAGALADFSTSGDWVDLVAPGFNIWSADAGSGSYVSDSGTSFSAPLVAGAVALARSAHRTLTPAEVAARLARTARDAGPAGRDPYYGAGVLDAYRALDGSWAGDLLPPGGDNDNTPALAGAHGESAGLIDIEGDVDWHVNHGDEARAVEVVVTPAPHGDHHVKNFDPVIEVYDADLRLLSRVDSPHADATETATVTVPAGPVFVAVSSYNGARTEATHMVKITTGPPGTPTAPGEQLWVKDLGPVPHATSVDAAATPTVTFARAMTPASVTAETVRLRDGYSGAIVPADVAFDAGVATITPAAPMAEGAPHLVEVGAVKDAAGATHAGLIRSVFRVANQAPPQVGPVAAVGGLNTATLTWAAPQISDLAEVVVLQNVGTVAPNGPDGGPGSGLAVRAGLTSATATGLVGASHTFAVWARDRSGVASPVRVVQLAGTATILGAAPTALVYGGTVTVTGRVTRRDNGAAVSNAPVRLYFQPVGRPATFLANLTTSASGAVTYRHRPPARGSYRLLHLAGGGLLASQAIRTVAVRVAISGALSAAKVRRGKTVRLSGAVRPAHGGQVVYLQRLTRGSWRNVASRRLTGAGGYAFAIRHTSPGLFAYRVSKPADADHLSNVTGSRSLRVT